MQNSEHAHGAIPYLLLPKPLALFQQRANRFRQKLKTQTSLTGYMGLMASLADIQHSLLDSMATGSILKHQAIIPRKFSPKDSAGKPPLDTSNWQWEPLWREMLHTIAKSIKPETASLATVLDQIQQAQEGEMETWADGLLAGEVENIEPGIAPFLAAALQIYWASMAAGLDVEKIGQAEFAYLCPVCGSLPVAGVLQTGATMHGLRYLCCGLCATQWNRPRIHCIQCGSSQQVALFGIEGAGDAIKAEACGDCETYIKLMNLEKDPGIDPVADDLASLALDLLMAGEGYQRLGFNPLLIPSVKA